MRSRETLRDAITKQGRRNDWLAMMIDLPKSQFSHVVAGRREIDLERAIRLAAILGLPVRFLFEFPNGNNNDPSGRSEAAV